MSEPVRDHGYGGAVERLGPERTTLTREERLALIREIHALRGDILASRGGVPIPRDELDSALETTRGGE